MADPETVADFFIIFFKTHPTVVNNIINKFLNRLKKANIGIL